MSELSNSMSGNVGNLRRAFGRNADSAGFVLIACECNSRVDIWRRLRVFVR
jgi:hypothetical protein